MWLIPNWGLLIVTVRALYPYYQFDYLDLDFFGGVNDKPCLEV